MTELKYEGKDVAKLMFGSQEIGGAAKLEPGTILHIADRGSEKFENVHLLSTTKNWNNINGISIGEASRDDILSNSYEANISGDDFKNLDIKKDYKLFNTVTVSRSTVDGEYRLNVSGYWSANYLVVRAI